MSLKRNTIRYGKVKEREVAIEKEKESEELRIKLKTIGDGEVNDREVAAEKEKEE